jgi:hypothetical protein
MSLITRPLINDVEQRLDAFEYIQTQIKESIIPMPFFKTDTKGKFFTDIEGKETELLESAINQILGIGGFAIRSFKDAQKVAIKDTVNSDIFMLNSVTKYADKPVYKYGVYDNKLTHVVNPKHPQIDGIRVFKSVFDQLGKLGLTPNVYNMEFDPISGRQNLELVVNDWNQDTSIELNKALGVGFKISNSTTGHGYFTFQLYAVQLVCTNGMIGTVNKGGLELLHRTTSDLLKKARQFIGKALNRSYVSLYSLNDDFYNLLAKSMIKTAEVHSSVISAALERAKAFKLEVHPKAYLEALGKKQTIITQKDVERMIVIHSMDNTIDRADNNLLNIVQSMTRLANEIENPVKREKIQELAYELSMTPMIVRA